MSSLVDIVYSFSIAWIFGNTIKIFKKIYLKIKFINILKCSELRAKQLVIPQEKKEWGIKTVLFDSLRQNINVELHNI